MVEFEISNLRFQRVALLLRDLQRMIRRHFLKKFFTDTLMELRSIWSRRLKVILNHELSFHTRREPSAWLPAMRARLQNVRKSCRECEIRNLKFQI
jgi:hypothetical protein